MSETTDQNKQLHDAAVREFAEYMGFTGNPESVCIFTSPVVPKERQVLSVLLGDKHYALKIDSTSAETGRLEKEFTDLTAINKHFDSYEKLGAAKPIYLSPSHTFFAMDYLDHLTAGKRLRHSQNDQTTRQVYRRVGLWLTALHDFKPQKRSKFFGRWMPQEIDHWCELDTMNADPNKVARMRAMLIDQIEEVQHTKDIRVWSHGDFHSENIMLGPGMTYAFDLTEARMKLAIYDIVDFLKVDIHRKAAPEDIDASGLISAHREMFFRGYKHKVKPKLFDVAMRGRLLIDWVAMSQQQCSAKASSQSRFANLENRLNIAFQI